MMENLFALNLSNTADIVKNALHRKSGGELFLEYKQTELINVVDGIVKNITHNTNKGFGLRGFCDEFTAFIHSSDVSEIAIQKAADTITQISDLRDDYTTSIANNNKNVLYTSDNPLEEIALKQKISTLLSIDHYIRTKDTRVVQVNLSFGSEWQVVNIIDNQGKIVHDIRPLVRLNIVVILNENNRMEQGFAGYGGRISCNECLQNWQEYADKALQQAEVNMQAMPAPAGEMPVVLGSGWAGIILHEAIGHGLEGDFNRKKTSVFSELMNEEVAAKEVTIVDDGTIPHRRGSLTIDDEGRPTQRNVLVENGRLVGYMHDNMNARLMNMQSTSNGRRESYAHSILPRMTNTYMLAGDKSATEIIASVEKGLYAVSFSGGQVDIVSGQFVFSAAESYLIESGKITTPVKGATLIGNGIDVLRRISLVGNDCALDSGIGTCGKEGQNIPVGVGQPTIKVDSITIGGTRT